MEPSCFFQMKLKKNIVEVLGKEQVNFEVIIPLCDDLHKKIYDSDLDKTLNKDKGSKIAHSKEVFAINVLEGEFTNQFNFDEFRKIFDIIQNIISNQN